MIQKLWGMLISRHTQKADMKHTREWIAESITSSIYCASVTCGRATFENNFSFVTEMVGSRNDANIPLPSITFSLFRELPLSGVQGAVIMSTNHITRCDDVFVCIKMCVYMGSHITVIVPIGLTPCIGGIRQGLDHAGLMSRAILFSLVVWVNWLIMTQRHTHQKI